MRLDERGFTLVEAVVGLFMMTAIGAAVVTLLRTQDIFYNRMDDAVIAQQNLRTTADLVGSEVRMSMPEDFIAARPESLTVRFDVAQAVMCEDLSSGLAPIFVYDSAPNPNITTTRGTAIRNPYQTVYDNQDGWTPLVNVVGGAAVSDCHASGAPTTAPSSQFRVVSFSTWPGAAAALERGSIVRFYRPLTYKFAPSQIGTGRALFRNGQELVGPLHPRSAFEYILDDGSVTGTPGIGNLADIRYVRINAIGIDDDPRYDIQRTLQFDIPLRK